MPKGLRRRYRLQHLHFITCGCYRRLPLLSCVRARNTFAKILGEVRDRYGFKLAGYVVMPEHIHLLISEPPIATPSKVMQVLKQRVSRRLRRKPRKKASLAQLRLPFRHAHDFLPQFWQPRFYDFNVWSQKKFVEKLHYMHMNPLKRKLVTHPRDWPWKNPRRANMIKSPTVPKSEQWGTQNSTAKPRPLALSPIEGVSSQAQRTGANANPKSTKENRQGRAQYL